MTQPGKIESLEKKLEQIKAQLAAAKSREKAQQRRDETRRKILVGAYFMEQAQTEKKMTELVKKLDPFLTKPADRKLFGLTVVGNHQPDSPNPNETFDPASSPTPQKGDGLG